jgi:hypothetical protein
MMNCILLLVTIMETFKKKMSDIVSGMNLSKLFHKGEVSVYTAIMDDKERGNVKYHMRVNPDGQGTLSINGDKVVFMNQTASDLMRLFLEGTPDSEVTKFMTKKYAVPAEEVANDYAIIKSTIDTIVHQRDVCPVVFQGVTPEAAMRSRGVPSRVDLALTYRCNNACNHCYVARDKTFPEMDTASWKKVIDKLYEIGVPHIALTGGEATVRDDLAEIIQHAQDNNIICGLITNGINLADKNLLQKLIDAGLDYIQVTLESHDGRGFPVGADRQGPQERHRDQCIHDNEHDLVHAQRPDDRENDRFSQGDRPGGYLRLQRHHLFRQGKGRGEWHPRIGPGTLARPHHGKGKRARLQVHLV